VRIATDAWRLWALALLVALASFVPLSSARGAAPPARGRVGGAFEVRVVKDVAYLDGKDADPIKHKLDLYLPKGLEGFPVVFFVHGGSWKSGDKKIYGPLGETFARNGVGMVITNYRLTPAVKHPSHAEDVARAFAWTHANVGKYGGRRDRLFLSGHSAGGHLVALLATDERYLKAEKLSFAAVRGVMALSGVYQITPGVFPATFGKDAEECRKASPLSHVNGKHAPFLIVYADKDYPFLGPLAKQLGAALKKSKCEAEVVEMKDRDHISIIKKLATDEGDPATRAMFAFVARRSGLEYAAKEVKK
jgi:acetyl esterase/lipase